MRAFVLVTACLAACGAPSTTPPGEVANRPAPPPSTPPPPPPPDARPAVTPTAEQLASCQGPGRRLHGTTCCESRGHDEKFPGMVFLTCTGPQVGAPCTQKADCDIACSCDPAGQMLDPRTRASTPADGARGVTGTCAGRLQIGVWMCQLDEHGVVTRVIVD